MKPAGGTITLRDVAERAGVSITTVSRILNGRETGVPVREATRERIVAAAKDLGYKPNLLARALRGSRSSLLGVIVRDISDPFHAQVLRGVNAVARARGYRLFLGHVDYQPDVAAIYGSMFEQSHADGILVMGDIQGGDAAIDDLADRHDHVVGVSDRVGPRRVPGVYVDNERGTILALEHLWELGHRSIVCVADERMADGPFRARVYEQFMRERRPGRPGPRLLHHAAGPRAELPPGPRAVRPLRPTEPPDGRLRGVGHDRDRAPPGRVPGQNRRPGPALDRGLRRHRHRVVHDPAADDDQPVGGRDGPDRGRSCCST